MSAEMSQPTAEQRTDPPYVADERTMLESWLDFHRATLLWKCEGLAGEQLAQRSVEPSTLSLLGLVRHMTEVERSWFRQRIAGEQVEDVYYRDDAPDADFDELDPARADAAITAFRTEIELCRAAMAGLDLDHVVPYPRRNTDLSLRWVYVHMIEEYARHNGHADLLRERIDGVIGD
jgi:hypothetical protein